MLTFWNCLLIAAGIFVALLLISSILWWLQDEAPVYITQMLLASIWIVTLAGVIYLIGLIFGFAKL